MLSTSSVFLYYLQRNMALICEIEETMPVVVTQCNVIWYNFLILNDGYFSQVEDDLYLHLNLIYV